MFVSYLIAQLDARLALLSVSDILVLVSGLEAEGLNS